MIVVVILCSTENRIFDCKLVVSERGLSVSMAFSVYVHKMALDIRVTKSCSRLRMRTRL